MSSSARNSQEARNNTHGDDAVTYELQEQGRFTLNIERNTGASFTNQTSPSITSAFVVPVSEESDIISSINDLVSEACLVTKSTEENERSNTGFFQYPS